MQTHSRNASARALRLHSAARPIVAVCVLTLLAGACFGETTPLTSPLMTPDDATLSKNSSKQEDIAQLVARGMALALGDSATRGAIRDLLRNSPNAYQAIHLQSYLEGTAGTTLTHAIANALQMPPAAFLAKLNSLPPLAFGMPPIADRVTWSGGADIDVAGTAKSRDELLSSPTLLAFGPGGAARELDASSTQRQRPVLIISPAPIDFGPDPEARRLKAKKRPKSGADQPIASPGGGVGVMLYTCEDMPEQDGCAWNPLEPSGPTVDLGWECSPAGYSLVSAAADQNRDGIKDACEQALIKAFEPEMVFYYYEIWHAREPHYIVERVNGVVTLGYLLSFYYDGGKVSHNGDSEMVIIRLAPSGQTSWAIGSITTTAHYGATFGWIFDETRTNGWQAFQFTGSHPRVFASNNHHGLYESEGRCDDRSYDSCSSGRPTVSFGVAHIDGIIQMLGQSYLGMDGLRPDNNIGNTATRLVIDAYGRFGTTPGGMTGCTYADNPSRPGFECYFKYGGYSQDPFGLVLYGGSFAGWSGQSGTTSYHSLLDDFGFNDPYR